MNEALKEMIGAFLIMLNGYISFRLIEYAIVDTVKRTRAKWKEEKKDG